MCAVLAISAPVNGQENVASVKLISGKENRGQVTAINRDSVSLKIEGSENRFPFDQISKIEFENSAATNKQPLTTARLVDGSVLLANQVSSNSGNYSIELSGLTSLSVPSRDLSWIGFKNYVGQPKLQKQLDDLIADRSRREDAIVTNRDGTLRAVEGIVGDLSKQAVSFSIGDRTADIALSRVDAILIYHADGRELATPLCKVSLTNESVMIARQILVDDARLNVTCVSGCEISVPLTEVAAIDFSFGKTTFLSNLQPTSNDWRPLLTSSVIYERLRKLKLAQINQSFSGSKLSLTFPAGDNTPESIRTFEHGFAIQGGGKLSFSLDGDYQRLIGQVGFDPNANPNGRVKLTISVDDNTVFAQDLVNQELTQPIRLDLEIAGARRLVFLVDYLDGRSSGDQLHMVDLQVTR